MPVYLNGIKFVYLNPINKIGKVVYTENHNI